MTHEQIYEYAMRKPGAYADMPFGDETLLIKVCGHYFVTIFTLRGKSCVTLKCSPEDGIAWRSRYPQCIARGWHCPTVQQPYNNTVDLTGEVSDDELRAMIDASYARVCAKLTKKERAALIEAQEK